MLGHDWAPTRRPPTVPNELFARKVMPHFKGQLHAPESSHTWAQNKRNDLFGRAGEAIMKAIGDHVGEQSTR